MWIAILAAVGLFTNAAVAASQPDGTVPPVIVRVVPATPIPVAAPEPLICRSSIETGSLIKRHKQCLTKAQWRYVNDQHETFARKIVEDGITKPFCDANC